MSLYTTKTDTPLFRLNNDADTSDLFLASPSRTHDDVMDGHVLPTCRQENLEQCVAQLNQVCCEFEPES